MDKLLRWRDFAQKFHGKEFWSSVFDNPETNNLFNNFSEIFGEKANFPKADVFKNEFEIIVLIELPGLNKEDVQLEIAGSMIKIRGAFQPLYPTHDGVTAERFYGPFERTIQLPEIVNKEGISAKIINGLLEVRFPRIQRVHAESIRIE